MDMCNNGVRVQIKNNGSPENGKTSHTGRRGESLDHEINQPDKARILPGSRNSMSKDINVWKSSRSSENCKKLSLIGDTERKGPAQKWEELKLKGGL